MIEPAFCTLLSKAKNVDGLLPPWWNDDKTADCIAYHQQSNHSTSLSAAAQDVQDEWKDFQMPMKLRMLGEKICGVGPGRQSAASMLSMMMAQEARAEGHSHRDMLQALGDMVGRRCVDGV